MDSTGHSSLTPPSRSLDGWAVLTLVPLALALLALWGRFYPTDGMVIELPAASPILITQENTAGAVAIRDAHHYVFGGTLLGATEMVAALAAYREDLPPERQTLLLHCDRRAPLESLLLAAAAAREAGFTAVQIAIPSVQAR